MPSLGSAAAQARLPCDAQQRAAGTMRRDPSRGDDGRVQRNLFGEIIGSLQASIGRAIAAGMPRERIVVEPGHRVGQDARPQHLRLRKHLGRLRELGKPIPDRHPAARLSR